MTHHHHHQIIQGPSPFTLFARLALIPIRLPFRGHRCNAFNISLDVYVSLKNMYLCE